ncbi:S8 family anti-phage peptidase IteS [Pseudomonas sp. LAIL14HWK12:I12]|uniref:S8 family anti-phage peptidase IteS n=1 Tax=Pseudomonas sp. LAIL14HWK12:I12 TaxID=1259803 RepID=UPI0004AD2E01|nr:S8 family anti-phage peptidase IteS [Pseudomonas sp. LAIL14HWK12:I12]
MARKNKPAQPLLNARVENPFIHVPFQPGDLSSIEGGGGGGGKELVEVNAAYRQALSRTLADASSALSREQVLHPQALTHLVLKLREKGIAKTHRPILVAEEAKLQPAGHGQIDEMLVGASANSLDVFDRVILHRDTKKIRSQLSVIESIEPWDRQRRNPEGSHRLLENGRAVLRLFQYQQGSFNAFNYETLVRILKSLSLPFVQIDQGRGLPIFGIRDLDKIQDDALEQILDFPGIRTIYAEKLFLPVTTVQMPMSGAVATQAQPTPQPVKLPTVAVFDSGVSSDAKLIEHFVKSRDPYVLPPDTNYEHGTAVASLVAGGAFFNDKHAWIPSTPAYVHDVCALEVSGSYMSDLEVRLQSAVKKRPDVKVWNISIGGEACDDNHFSDIAMALDQLSDKYQVLFVVAAGNYNDLPRREWQKFSPLADRISSPGESVRALTVGSISHIDAAGTLSAVGHPAPYSRCGPGPVFTPKPDITHVGGGVHAPWNAGSASLKVLWPDNQLRLGFGTSYAAPLASCMAAHAWQAVAGRPSLNPSPSLVKALMIHAAQLSSPDYDSYHRRYLGAGRPEDVLKALYDSDDSFTLVFQANLVPGNMRWRKTPYPIPDVLIEDGKFRGEVIITAAYAPPLDPNSGSEYVRANVELSFGAITGDTIQGMVPMDSDEGQSGYEIAQISAGGKWSPVKVHRATFPNGTAVKQWGLQAKARLRAYEPELTEALPVNIIVTLRSLDRDPQVRAAGLKALSLRNWVHTPLPVRVPIRV